MPHLIQPNSLIVGPSRTARRSGSLSGGGGGAPAVVASSFALLRDESALGTDGGTFTSGARRTRTVDTVVSDPDSIVTTLASNQFTLEAGTYTIRWSTIGNRVGRHKSWLYNVTDAADAGVGISTYAANTQTDMTHSEGVAVVTIAAQKAFEIQHRAQNTFATTGLGNAGSVDVETYTTVTVEKH